MGVMGSLRDGDPSTWQMLSAWTTFRLSAVAPPPQEPCPQHYQPSPCLLMPMPPPPSPRRALRFKRIDFHHIRRVAEGILRRHAANAEVEAAGQQQQPQRSERAGPERAAW